MKETMERDLAILAMLAHARERDARNGETVRERSRARLARRLAREADYNDKVTER